MTQQIGAQILDALGIESSKVSQVRILLNCDGPDVVEVTRWVLSDDAPRLKSVLEKFRLEPIE